MLDEDHLEDPRNSKPYSVSLSILLSN
jgi:hypothetical protein